MIKLIIIALAFWLLWGYDLLPPFSFFGEVGRNFIESTSKDHAMAWKCEDTTKEKRRKRW